MRRFATVLLLCSFALPVVLHAQPILNFKRVTLNWPTVELYFSAACSGVPAFDLQASNFRLRDNDEEVLDFTISCPDPTQRCSMSAGLVFDASGSMQGAGTEGAKAAGLTFIQRMDGVTDEAAVIWFNSWPTLQQGMTTDKALLNAAIDAIPASGPTATWDAIWMGLEEVSGNGTNECRFVIVVTDGSDGSSLRTPAELITFANRHRIRVFTIGLGSSINPTELEYIALLTGGRYYQTPNPAQLPMIYEEIATISVMGFQECRITYEASRADGLLHTVELQLADFCGGADTKTKVYRAPLDTTTAVGDAPLLAGQFRLHAWPEPAHGSVTVDAEVPAGQPVTLRLTDMLGRSEVVYDGVVSDGHLTLPLSLAGRPSGVLLLTLTSGRTQIVRRITRL